jgi:hypothetical protein
MIPELSQRFGVSYRVVRNVFLACHYGKSRPEKQKKGADNPGLITGAAALNGSASPDKDEEEEEKGNNDDTMMMRNKEM